MFDDLFLAMGCGIENKMPETEGSIVTTIDQTGLKPDFKQGKAIVNNGFYYQVLKQYTQGNIVLDTTIRTTQWKSMCIENKLPETEEAIFHLYIDHGQNARNASYAYTVSCSKEALSEVPVVLSNTVEVQAAESFDGKKLGAVFYVPGVTLQSSKGFVKASAPCALLFEEKDGQLLLSVTDGLMDKSLKEIVIETSIPVKGNKVCQLSDRIYSITVPLPDGQRTGTPALLQLEIVQNNK